MPLEKKLVIVFFGIWCILAFKLVIFQLQKTFTLLLPVYSLSLEEKQRVIDGDFYGFVKQCEAQIGLRETALFKVVPREPDFRAADWFLKEYFVGRLSYLLYPRKILRGQNVTDKPGYSITFDTDSRALRLTRL